MKLSLAAVVNLVRANIKHPITANDLRKILKYDPSTGAFAWVKPIRRAFAGSVQRNGYMYIHIGTKFYKASRLAWLYMTGGWPTKDVDHKNGIRTDDRWENLRDVSRAENMHNQRKSAGRLGIIGVSRSSRNKNTFVASICVNYKQHHLGTFPTVQEAHAAYLEAKRKLHKGAIWDE